MTYKTKCPNCKTEGSLEVTVCIWGGNIPLTRHGFDFKQGITVATSDEVVVCGECKAEFKLADLMKE